MPDHCTVPATIYPGLFRSEWSVRVDLPNGTHRTMWVDKSFVTVNGEPTAEQPIQGRLQGRVLNVEMYPSTTDAIWIELPAECLEGGQRCRVPRAWVQDA